MSNFIDVFFARVECESVSKLRRESTDIAAQVHSRQVDLAREGCASVVTITLEQKSGEVFTARKDRTQLVLKSLTKCNSGKAARVRKVFYMT